MHVQLSPEQILSSDKVSPALQLPISVLLFRASLLDEDEDGEEDSDCPTPVELLLMFSSSADKVVSSSELISSILPSSQLLLVLSFPCLLGEEEDDHPIPEESLLLSCSVVDVFDPSSELLSSRVPVISSELPLVLPLLDEVESSSELLSSSPLLLLFSRSSSEVLSSFLLGISLSAELPRFGDCDTGCLKVNVSIFSNIVEYLICDFV